MTLGVQEVVRRLGFHPATPQTIPVFEENRHRAIEYALYLDETLPDGFEKDEALKYLQIAAMLANASVACRTPLENGLPPDGHRKPGSQ